LACKEGIVLDFFAGSSATAHAVMQLNKEDGGLRKYICVQLPELCDEKSEAYKAGYKTIAEISKERIRRASAKIREEVEAEQAKRKEQLEFDEDQAIEMPDLGFKVFKLLESNFKQWREIKGSNKEEWKQQMLDFINPIAENATTDNMVYELLLKSGKSLNSSIEHKNGYYAINGKELILILESATQEVVDAVLAEHPQKVIALDNLFEGNDQLKTNTALQMRDAGVEFRTI
jgi:adenine-specific DNA-methyltransferase